MLSKSLVEDLFRAFSIERWNDKLRPIELIQIDKHAHKMFIAYCLGKYEEELGHKVEWLDVIRGGVYELIRRSVISDIQSPVFREISNNKKLVQKLNFMIYKEMEGKFGNAETLEEFRRYLMEEDYLQPLARRILDAAHKYSTYWEFQIVRNANPEGYNISDIQVQLSNELAAYSDLEGIRRIQNGHHIKNFVNLVGELRYQVRWGHLPRIPKTSVLGHVMLVAVMAYFLTKELDSPAPKRIYNNFWGALFHDLPEVVTRDIISPVKRSVPGMNDEIKRIERMLTERDIFPQVEKAWIPEIRFFTEEEFFSKIREGELVKDTDISDFYNDDSFNPYDGYLLKAADDFAAFLEAWSSIQYGVKSRELEEAISGLKLKYKNRSITGLPVHKLFENFD